MTAVIETRGVTKRFGRVDALDGVDFTLQPGEVHALAGENGAGKSTLIKILTGFHRPTAGEVLLDGERVAFASPHDSGRRGIACVYQEIDLVPTRSVAQNVFLGSEPRTRLGLVDTARMRSETAAILRRFELDVDVDATLGDLSLGLQQMVAIARAVSSEAKVLILDEPTSALDTAEAEALAGVVRRLSSDGVAVVYVSHRLDEVYDLCDRITVLRDGRVVRAAATSELPRGELVAEMLGRELVAEQRQEHRAVAATAEPVLSVTNLSWGNRIRGIDLEVAPGEIVGLAGLLGAGRTETAKAVFGAVHPTSGEVRVNGRRVRPGSPGSSIAAGMAFLPEDRAAEGVIPELSVRENVLAAVLPRLSRGGWTRPAAQRDTVAGQLDRLGVKAAGPEQPVIQLSGGNQQKVLLARWLATRPTVLILDEPTRGIDVGAKAEIQAQIRRLADDGLGVLVISSEIDEVVHGTDRVIVLRDGMVAGELRGDDITEPNLLALYSGEERVS